MIALLYVPVWDLHHSWKHGDERLVTKQQISSHGACSAIGLHGAADSAGLQRACDQ